MSYLELYKINSKPWASIEEIRKIANCGRDSAIKFYGLKENIASLTGNFKRKNELKKNVDFCTFEEYSKFISVVDNNVYKALFETLYYTGIRQGEALALSWKDFVGDYINIDKTISKEKVDGKYIVNTPKTPKSIRKVKLDKDLIN